MLSVKKKIIADTTRRLKPQCMIRMLYDSGDLQNHGASAIAKIRWIAEPESAC